MKNASLVWDLILELRSNIELEGDLQLAELEIRHLLGSQPQPLYKEDLPFPLGQLCRRSGVVAYRVCAQNVDLFSLFHRLTFVQTIIGEIQGISHIEVLQAAADRVPSEFVRLNNREGRCSFRLIPFNTAAEWSDIIAKYASDAEQAIQSLRHLLSFVLSDGTQTVLDHPAAHALKARTTTSHLFHGLHVYKAKFFPRMVRTLLNVYVGHSGMNVLDPYAGSGTTLVEASVLGTISSGIDIDPLSARIATAKVQLLHDGDKHLQEVLAGLLGQLEYECTGQLSLFQAVRERRIGYGIIPSFLSKRIPESIQKEVSEDIACVLTLLENCEPEIMLPIQIALSDAISRKFKFRFLGLGYGRFSLNVTKGRVVDRFRESLHYLEKSIAVWHWLRETTGIQPAPSSVGVGNVCCLPNQDNTIDLVLTSPPYMPASSGRENYLKSKALAMIALGLIHAEDIEAHEREQMGSVHRSSEDVGKLPAEARELIEWMASDPVRQVKTAATVSYFKDLQLSLSEIKRVLRLGGCCAFVIARQHTFYRYQSREIVRVIDNANIVSTLAKSVGLEVENAIHIELKKQNAVARPRSLDAYYETVLILRKV
jgi:hypothetical protein